MDSKMIRNNEGVRHNAEAGLARKISQTMIFFSGISIFATGLIVYLAVKKGLSVFSQEIAIQVMHSVELTIGLITLVIITISIPIAIFLSKIMTKPVVHLNDLFSRMALGEVDFDLQSIKTFEVMPKNELGQMMESFITMVENRKQLVAVAESIAKGDLSVLIRPQSEQDVLAHSLGAIIDQLKRLETEMHDTGFEVAFHGHFDFKGNPEVLNGSYQDFISGLNAIMEGLIQPIKTASHCINEIGAGRIPEKITESFNGDFNLLKDSINDCIDGLGALTEGNEVLALVRNSDFSRKIEGDYNGIYGTISESINWVIEGFISIINMINNIAQGDFSDLGFLKEFGKQSENDRLIPSLIEMIETILLLIKETETMTANAVSGNLQQRGDTTQFCGDYAKVIDGFNQTLNAVVAPINEASAALIGLSKGNLKAKMIGDYQGDHAAIKEALNQTSSFLNQIAEEITLTLKAIQQGDLNKEITADYHGDFYEIKVALNDITTQLSNTLSEIDDAAEQVESGAKQISSGGQTLSQGTTEQASAIEELTAAIEEVAMETKKNAISANQANELTQTVRENAELGNNQMNQMMMAMNEINLSSKNISKIIKVIDDIAFQTNILALNAAVEAARAGQHGKGFAVVAEEVRTLAARSAEAVKETTVLIEGSIKKVEVGSAIADETANSLMEILNRIEEVTDIVSNISKGASEQALAITQISQGIEEVSQVVQTNSATSQQSAAASEELSSQAEMLKQMIGAFNLKNTESEAIRKRVSF